MSPRKTLQDMKKLAARLDGKCLSKSYRGTQSKLLWQCGKGHRWRTKPATISQNCWCPYCAGTQKSTLKDLRDLAKSRGGKILSRRYVTAHEKALWRCSQGHLWEARPMDIRSGHWCSKCKSEKRRKDLFQSARLFAGKREGRCLSKEYVSARAPLTWKCQRGHIWIASLQNVLRLNRWCSRCARIGRHEKVGLEVCQRLARTRGGKCLSAKYIDRTTKMKWRCAQRHVWFRSAGDTQAGKWCPHCPTHR